MGAELKKLFQSEGPQPDEAAVLIARDLIEANPAQPRQRFDPGTLRELGASMRANGQLQECIVRPHPSAPGRYQLVAGERRWRAAAPEYGDIPELRCVVRHVDDAQALVLAIEENARREDISPMERAQSLVNLKNLRAAPQSTKGMTWEEVARKVGLTRAAVDRFVQLLKLPEPVVERFQALDLNEKHGRGLLLLKDHPLAQMQLLAKSRIRDSPAIRR
jgi:ParB family chromosome partitioning protein